MGLIEGWDKRDLLYLLVYGDGDLSHHPNHLINSQQILTVKNEFTIDPTVGDYWEQLFFGPFGWIIRWAPLGN